MIIALIIFRRKIILLSQRQNKAISCEMNISLELSCDIDLYFRKGILTIVQLQMLLTYYFFFILKRKKPNDTELNTKGIEN